MGNYLEQIQAELANLQNPRFFVSGLTGSGSGNSISLFKENPEAGDLFIGPVHTSQPAVLWTPFHNRSFTLPNLFSNKVAQSLMVDRSFIPRAGRVTRGFDTASQDRVWQAEQILRSFGAWPPQDGEIFAIQIDQDSPPPLPTRPPASKRKIDGNPSPEEAAWQQALAQLKDYLLAYTGETVLFQAIAIANSFYLAELNPKGPFRSASHPGQLNAGNIVSCIKGACGIPWLRSGIYPYKTHNYGYVFFPTGTQFMWSARDQNGDGSIDLQESKDSEKSYGLGLNIHLGFKNSPKSIGCQTIPPDDFKSFVEIINESGQKTFQYVLVRRPNEITGEYAW